MYTENIFKASRHGAAADLAKCLLEQRLHSIRYFELNLELGYPWHVMRLALDALTKMRGLKGLRIDGIAKGMIDGHDTDMIDLHQWRNRRDQIIPFISKLNFIKDVDVYFPILEADLGKDIRVGKCRIHGIQPKNK